MIKPEKRPQIANYQAANYAVPVGKAIVGPSIEDFMAYDYENEEPTDEARTNEEAYEELQQLGYAKF